jgi:adenine-specific DNA glycosylase
MKKIKLENKTSVCFDETKQKLSNRKQTTHSSEQPELHPYHVIDEEKKKIMRDKLLSWFYKYKRRLPWRGDAPPYTSGTDIRNHINRENCCTLNKYFEMNHSAKSIKNELPLEKTQYQNNSFTTYNRTAYGTWVSEVMLQQTQVSVVIPYWIKWYVR